MVNSHKNTDVKFKKELDISTDNFDVKQDF